jgi:hypothetical protein
VRRVAFGLTLAMGGPLAGQGSASMTVNANVVTAGITINALRNLDFGVVPKGVATTVQPTAAGAGAWQVVGDKNAFATISFTLPTVLNNIQAAPGSTMPITFNGTAARWNRANNNPSSGTAFDPKVGTTGRFGPPPNPTLYIWIGGTVTPPGAAKPGIYQGTIVVTIVYL